MDKEETKKELLEEIEVLLKTRTKPNIDLLPLPEVYKKEDILLVAKDLKMVGQIQEMLLQEIERRAKVKHWRNTRENRKVIDWYNEYFCDEE